MIHRRRGPAFTPDQVNLRGDSLWRRAWLISGVIGVAGLGASYALMTQMEDKANFYFSYLTAVMVFLALGLGGLFFVLIQHAARAGWSIVVRRLAENMMLALPALAILALPIIFTGVHDLFHWSHVDPNDTVLQAKEAYLNEGSFRTRGLVYMVVWTVMALGFYYWSTTQDESHDPAPYAHNMRRFAPAGILLFAVSLTFGAFDWLMSLDPHWFSTIFGVYYFAGAVVSTHAFLALIVILLHRAGYLRGVVTAEHFHDLGKMMFAFTVFWGYIGFSQYFLIWYASIPEETEWFSYRGQGDYLTVSLVLVFMRFVFPFLGLISRHIKRNPRTLMFWAIWVLVAQVVDMFWLIHPVHAHATEDYSLHLSLVDVTTLVGVGGVFFAVFAWGLQRQAMIPIRDPRIEESIEFENHGVTT